MYNHISDLRLLIADCLRRAAEIRDAAMMATSSLASFSKGSTLAAGRRAPSMINSIQKALSSASSSTIPILAMNSARERPRQQAR
jgi:hypothetical protein